MTHSSQHLRDIKPMQTTFKSGLGQLISGLSRKAPSRLGPGRKDRRAE